MLTNQTIEILKKLSKDELKKFGDFIKSPYFNSTKALEKMFDVVQDAYPDFTSKLLQYEKMFKKLYPSEEYKEKRIKNLYAEFSTLLRNFIGYEHINYVKGEFDAFITGGLTARGLPEISNKLIAKSLKENDDGLLSMPDRFYYYYSMHVNYVNNLGSLRKHGLPEYLKADIELMETLTIYFFGNIFQASFYDVMNKRILKIEENPVLKTVANSIDAEKILSYFESTDNEYTSNLKIHYMFYTLYSRDTVTEEGYSELKKEILKTIRKVKKYDQNQFIVRMIHILVIKLAPLNRKYYDDIIEFAELLNELKIYPGLEITSFINGPFRDIFISAIALKKYDWAENFVDRYMGYLSEKLRADTENFCRGILSFKRGKFEDSLRHFNEVKMVDIVEKLNIRFYYVMNYIELNSYESAFSALQSLRQFINTNEEIPEMLSEKVHESLKYFNEIIKCEEKGGKINEWIYKDLLESKGVVHKQYLQEKMEKLM